MSTLRSRAPGAASGRRATLQAPSYGVGSHTIHVPDYELADPVDLTSKLLAAFRSPAYKPPVLPGLALELTELTRKPNVAYGEVASVLERDPLIVAKVLRVAQSPAYQTRAPVQSLKEALNRLGIAALRDIVWQIVAHIRLFRVKGYHATMQRLHAHSLCTAHLSRLVATHARIASEHAFLCGLLHDVGISGTLLVVSERDHKPPELSLLWPAVDKVHPEAGGLMGELWGLAPDVVEVIAKHHSLDLEAHTSPAMVSVLCVAERLAGELGFDVLAKPSDASAGQVDVDRCLADHYEYAVQRLQLGNRIGVLREQAKQTVGKLEGALA